MAVGLVAAIFSLTACAQTGSPPGIVPLSGAGSSRPSPGVFVWNGLVIPYTYPLLNSNGVVIWPTNFWAVNGGSAEIMSAASNLVASGALGNLGAILFDPITQTMAAASKTNLFPYWNGKTTNNWKVYNSDGTFSTNCWTFGLDFSGLAAGPLNAAIQTNGVDDISLITPYNGITAQHFWSGWVGMPVIFNNTNGTFFTNYVAAATQLLGLDLEVITFSNAAPAGVNPFPILPSSAISYVPTNLLGDELVWMRNNGQGGPHMNIQLSDLGPTGGVGLWGASSQAETNAPFYEAPPATSGDSGSPVWIVLRMPNGQLRPVFCYSLYANYVAGPWVSWAGYLPAVQAALGTNQVQFVDLTAYYGTLPSLPPNGSANEHGIALPLSGQLGPFDEIFTERNPAGSPSTQLTSLSNLLFSLSQLPNWPSNATFYINSNGVDLRVTANTWTQPNTFSNSVNVSGNENHYGTVSLWGQSYLYSADLLGDPMIGIGSDTGGEALWFGVLGSHTNAVLYTPGPTGWPLSIYAGSNVTSLSGIPASIKDGVIYANGGALTNIGTNGFSASAVAWLIGLAAGGTNGVGSFDGRTGAVTLSAADVNSVGNITNNTTGNAGGATNDPSGIRVANTNLASTSSAGLSPKLPNDVTKFYDGTGNFSNLTTSDLTNAIHATSGITLTPGDAIAGTVGAFGALADGSLTSGQPVYATTGGTLVSHQLTSTDISNAVAVTGGLTLPPGSALAGTVAAFSVLAEGTLVQGEPVTADAGGNLISTATLNLASITATNLLYPTNAMASVTNNLDASRNFQLLVTSTSCQITGLANLTQTNVNWWCLTVSNAASTNITLTLPPSVQLTDPNTNYTTISSSGKQLTVLAGCMGTFNGYCYAGIFTNGAVRQVTK